MTVLHVVFTVGRSDYVIPASQVVQMESLTEITAVPGANANVAGLVQVRGKVIPAIDARRRFGLPPLASTPDTRLLVASSAGRTVALIVDRAREVVKLSDEQLSPPPPVLQEESRGLVKAVAQLGPRLLLLLDFDKVLNEGHDP